MEYTDDEIRQWARIASQRGGSFTKAFGMAVLMADDNNFVLLRPVAIQIIAKYPGYLEVARREALGGGSHP